MPEVIFSEQLGKAVSQRANHEFWITMALLTRLEQQELFGL